LNTTTDSNGGLATYFRDNLGRLQYLITNQNAAQLSYQYNADSQVTAKTDSLGGTAYVQTTYVYDVFGRLTGQTDLSTGPSFLGVATYTLDNDGRVTARADNFYASGTLIQAESVSYTYDKSGELLNVGGSITGGVGGSAAATYTYDAAGNPSGTGVTIVNGRMTSDGTSTYTYDADGNLTRKTTISTGAYTTYLYDAFGDLEGVTNFNASNVVQSGETYYYDALGRRAAVFSTAAAPFLTVYQGATPYADFTPASPTTPSVRYLVGDDGLLGRVVAGSPTAQWYLTDNLGSVRELVANNGGIIELITYNAFGSVIGDTNPSGGDRFKYAGGDYSAVTSLDQFGARYYAAGTTSVAGRWTTPDPIGFDGGDWNLYRYVGNDPTNEVDPSGLISIYFEGTGQPVGRATTIQTLFGYTTDPLTFLYTNPRVDDDQIYRDRIIKDAIYKIVQARAKNQNEKIYLYGYSRGSIEAIMVSNALNELNIRVEFVGVIDPVSNPIIGLGGIPIENNVSNFFVAGRTGSYDPTKTFTTQEKALDNTVFRSCPVRPNFKSMSPKHQAHMKEKLYDTSHAQAGFPISSPAIYNDLLGNARNAGAPYPAGPLPPGGNKAAPKGTVVVIDE
jgi:RHS repeat-associated protein